MSVAGRVDHEQAVERWEHKPPPVGGGAAAMFAAGKIWNPFEKKARFSPDGQLLAAVSDVDRHVRVWDWRAARPLTPPLEHFRSPLTTFAFGSDGTTIASAAYDDTIRLWSFARPIGDALAAGSRDRVDELVFSPDGRTIAMAGYQPTPEIWKPHADGRELTLDGHRGAIAALIFSPDGTLVATGSYDKTVRVHDARTGRPICDPLSHAYAVNGVLFHSGSRLLTWSSGYDTPGEIRAWELPSGRLLGTMTAPSAAAMAAWSPDGTCAAIALNRRSTYGIPDEELHATSRPLVWDVERNTTVTLPAVAEQPEWIAFNEDGSELWVYGGGRIDEFSAAGGAALRTYAIESPFPRLLTVSREQVRVWSAATGRLLAPPFVHDVRVNRAVLDASGSRVVISTYPKRDGAAGSPSTIQF